MIQNTQIQKDIRVQNSYSTKAYEPHQLQNKQWQLIMSIAADARHGNTSVVECTPAECLRSSRTASYCVALC